MTPAVSSSEPPAAIAAFVHGVRRRASLFLRWHGADATQARRIRESAERRFEAIAADHPVAAWPVLFWRQLLADPDLRMAEPAGGVAIAGLGRLPRGPRATVLLRLVAELDEDSAAQVLAIAPGTYRMALQRSLPRMHDGRPDAETWRVLQQRVQAALRDPSALSVPASGGVRQQPVEPASPPPPSWRRPALAATAVLTLAALALTFRSEPERGADPPPPDGTLTEHAIRVEALSEAPAGRGYGPDLALLTEPSLMLLIDDPPLDPLRDLAFDAWHAAQLAIAAEIAAAQPLPEPAVQPVEAGGEETDDEHP